MKTHIAVAWALGVTGVAMFVTGLILSVKQKPPEPPLDQDVLSISNGGYGGRLPTAGQIPVRQKDGSIIWESPLKDTVPADTPPKLGPNEVVTTDSNPTPLAGSLVVTDKVLFAASSGIRWNSIEDVAREQGKHVITQAEAEEVVKALSVATQQAEPVQFGFTHAVYLTPAAQAQETANRLAREEAELSAAKVTLAKWRKRVEEGKP